MLHLFILFLLAATLSHAQITVQLNNSRIVPGIIGSGDLQHYFFSASTLPLLDRRSPQARAVSHVFLTLTICSQPMPPASYEGQVPSLDIFLSTSSANTLPGPNQGVRVNDTMLGRIAWESDMPVSDLWIGVVAPTLTQNWVGNWTYQLAVSTQQWMHPVLVRQDGSSEISLDDTDQTRALLLITNNNTLKQDNASLIITSGVPEELKHSLCAAELHRQNNLTMNITETVRGQQILISNLTASSPYTAYYIQTRGPIQSISAPLSFQAKADPNCKLVYNLAFCDQVAYSVAANPADDDISNLALQYDNQARALFEPFNIAISQFNCETTKYSLVRNCTHCYNDYKRWLCAVSIPRCTSSAAQNQTGVATRPVETNQSRNPWIDETLSPGTWTEMLPCMDLCYQVVQSCPPFMAFNCPKGDLASLQYGYWKRTVTLDNGTVVEYGNDNPTCNRVGLEESRLVISGSWSALHPSLSVLFSLPLFLAFLFY
ncbi:stretch-activated Ca2+-permeable channel component-domain-containing protein [Dichotomocladium elegans]|nr:stretch-activated Ca2+-permeable channel component-domain-containing protein [Dichotomocladium elegans]